MTPAERRDLSIPTRLGDLHVQIAGDGEPIVMWPSLLMDASLWDAQVSCFAGDHLTIAVDPPGHGRSTPLSSSFTLADSAGCVVDVLDHLGLERCHLIGNSWGAMTGGTFAALHPERAGSMVLMNGTASTAPSIQRIRYRALLTAARVMGGIRPPLTGAVVGAFLGPTSRRTRPDVVRVVRRTAEANDVRSALWAVRSVVMERPDQRELFGRITTPVLVVAGKEDATFPEAELREMADAIPQAEFVVLDGAAHLAAAEVPDTVNRLVADFLARHP